MTAEAAPWSNIRPSNFSSSVYPDSIRGLAVLGSLIAGYDLRYIFFKGRRAPVAAVTLYFLEYA